MKKNIINSPWGVGLGTTLFSFLLTLTNDYFKKTPFLTTVGNLVKKIINFTVFILNFKVKIWIILAIIILLFLIVFIISKNSNETKENKLNNAKKQCEEHIDLLTEQLVLISENAAMYVSENAQKELNVTGRVIKKSINK